MPGRRSGKRRCKVGSAMRLGLGVIRWYRTGRSSSERGDEERTRASAEMRERVLRTRSGVSPGQLGPIPPSGYHADPRRIQSRHHLFGVSSQPLASPSLLTTQRRPRTPPLRGPVPPRRARRVQDTFRTITPAERRVRHPILVASPVVVVPRRAIWRAARTRPSSARRPYEPAGGTPRAAR